MLDGDIMRKILNIQTKDYIITAIRNEILAGNLKAGEELLQEELAEMLGVSRMPVREALQTLVQEGFVERLPNRHMRVIALDQNQIREVFRIAAAMEYELIRLLLEKTDVSQLAEAILQQISGSVDRDTLVMQELELHQSLIGRLKNQYLEQFFQKILCGYVTFAIERFGETGVKADITGNLCRALIGRDETELKKQCNRYYEYYAQQSEVSGRQNTFCPQNII